jgi:hypothetical protein
VTETDTAPADPEEDVLYEVVVDGVFGAVAGFAGTVVLTAFLLASSLFGGFRFENFAATTEILLLDPYVGSLSAVVGYVVFVVGGSVVWPLMLASIGTYLPGEEFSTKGAVFGLVVWPGFLLGFGDVLSTTTLGYAAFVVCSLAGHVAYGYVMGDVFDRLYTAKRPVITHGLSPFDLAERSVADAGGTATEQRSARTKAAARARATTADEAETEEKLRDVDVADLPPLLRFDQAIERIDAELDDGEYPQFEAFKREYEQLKRSPSNRQTLVSDLRADINGLYESLPDDDDTVQRWLDSMGNRMFTYLKSGRTPSLTLDLVDVTLTKDDEPADLEALRESLATASVTVLNQGDRSGAVVRVSFYNEDDILLRSDDLSMGYMDPGERKQLSTKVYVPSIADHYEATVLDPNEGQRFIEGL